MMASKVLFPLFLGSFGAIRIDQPAGVIEAEGVKQEGALGGQQLERLIGLGIVQNRLDKAKWLLAPALPRRDHSGAPVHLAARRWRCSS